MLDSLEFAAEKGRVEIWVDYGYNSEKLFALVVRICGVTSLSTLCTLRGGFSTHAGQCR